VIAAVPFQEKSLAEILKSGARFLGLAPRTLSDIYTDIMTIAGAVGASDRGEEVISAMQTHIAEIRSRTFGARAPRVFCEEWGKPMIASQPWVAELVEAAGGKLVGVPSRQYTPDEIASLDPEIIIAAWCGAGDRVPLEKMVVDRRWQHTSAASTGGIFCIRDEFLNTPAPTLLHGLDAVARAIHPEIFPRTKGIRQITGVPASTVGKSAD
jgi:iron complex transport system substrate-binding protein